MILANYDVMFFHTITKIENYLQDILDDSQCPGQLSNDRQTHLTWKNLQACMCKAGMEISTSLDQFC